MEAKGLTRPKAPLGVSLTEPPLVLLPEVANGLSESLAAKLLMVGWNVRAANPVGVNPLLPATNDARNLNITIVPGSASRFPVVQLMPSTDV